MHFGSNREFDRIGLMFNKIIPLQEVDVTFSQGDFYHEWFTL